MVSLPVATSTGNATTDEVQFCETVAPGYRVGNDGSVWSSRDPSGNQTNQWRPLSLYRRPYGSRYVVVCLRPETNGKVRCFYVHRLVLEAFCGPCPDGMVACHYDGDTSNNHVDNLRWDTPTENANDTDRHGNRLRGSDCKNAKLSDEDIIDIRRFYAEGFSQAQVGSFFGINQSQVSAILLGKKWGHVPGENPPVRPQVKLTTEDARSIRQLRINHPSMTSGELARRFGVSRSAINRVLNNKTWTERGCPMNTPNLNQAPIPTADPTPEPCTCGTACPCRSVGPHLYVYPPASRSVRQIQAAQHRTADLLTRAERFLRLNGASTTTDPDIPDLDDDPDSVPCPRCLGDRTNPANPDQECPECGGIGVVYEPSWRDRIAVLDAPFGLGDLEPAEPRQDDRDDSDDGPLPAGCPYTREELAEAGCRSEEIRIDGPESETPSNPSDRPNADPSRPAALDWPETEETDGHVWELGPAYETVADRLDPILFNLMASIDYEAQRELDLRLEACFDLGRGAGYRGAPMVVPGGFDDATEAREWLLGWDAGRDDREREIADRLLDEEEINAAFQDRYGDRYGDRWASQSRVAAGLLDTTGEPILCRLSGIPLAEELTWADDELSQARSNGGHPSGWDAEEGGQP